MYWMAAPTHRLGVTILSSRAGPWRSSSHSQDSLDSICSPKSFSARGKASSRRCFTFFARRFFFTITSSPRRHSWFRRRRFFIGPCSKRCGLKKAEWWIWAGAGVDLIGTALLLFKQSGFLLLAISVLLPFARLQIDQNAEAASSGRYRWKSTALNVVLIDRGGLRSRLAADATLPSGSMPPATVQQQMGHASQRNPSFPVEIWRVNLANVADYIGSYYTWVVAPFFCWFTWLALRRKNFVELTLAVMCRRRSRRGDVSASRL